MILNACNTLAISTLRQRRGLVQHALGDDYATMSDHLSEMFDKVAVLLTGRDDPGATTPPPPLDVVRHTIHLGIRSGKDRGEVVAMMAAGADWIEAKECESYALPVQQVVP